MTRNSFNSQARYSLVSFQNDRSPKSGWSDEIIDIVSGEKLFLEITRNQFIVALSFQCICLWIHRLCVGTNRWNMHVIPRCHLDYGRIIDESWLWRLCSNTLNITVNRSCSFRFWNFSDCANRQGLNELRQPSISSFRQNN